MGVFVQGLSDDGGDVAGALFKSFWSDGCWLVVTFVEVFVQGISVSFWRRVTVDRFASGGGCAFVFCFL